MRMTVAEQMQVAQAVAEIAADLDIIAADAAKDWSADNLSRITQFSATLRALSAEIAVSSAVGDANATTSDLAAILDAASAAQNALSNRRADAANLSSTFSIANGAVNLARAITVGNVPEILRQAQGLTSLAGDPVTDDD